MNTTTLTVIIVVAVVVILLLALFFLSRRSRSQRREEQRERSRQEFGSEYERTAEERGSEEEAERELRERRSRVERRVEPLSDEGRHEERWGEVERVFVENPERSIEMADRAVSDLLEERNLVADPAQGDAQTEGDLAVMYPEVADDYREARRIRADVVSGAYRGSGEGASEETTEQLRQAIRRYRSVHERLLRD